MKRITETQANAAGKFLIIAVLVAAGPLSIGHIDHEATIRGVASALSIFALIILAAIWALEGGWAKTVTKIWNAFADDENYN